MKSNGLKEGWFEGAGIIFEVVLVVLITAMSNLKQSRHFLRIFQETNTKVVRCGQVVEVPILEVVVGDIVELGVGDSVPADGLLVQSDLSLAIDESDFSRQLSLPSSKRCIHPVRDQGTRWIWNHAHHCCRN